MSTLGNDPAVISGAAAVVAAEQNFNPFNVDIPSICGDASLPATAELRGIVPLVDPAVDGSDSENANSATSLTTPFDATGLSVADVMTAQGFTNFKTVDASGNAVGSGNANAATGNAATGNAASGNAASGNASDSTASTGSSDNSNAGCNAASSNANTGSNNAADSSSGSAASNSTASTGSSSSGSSSDSGANTGAATGATAGATDLAGADFGQCTPTMDFQLGRAGRKATEGTFLPTDPLVAKGQQDALNPNIITNRICDQLTNVCDANQAAKDACASAKALVQSLGTKDASTADAFNQALGF